MLKGTGHLDDIGERATEECERKQKIGGFTVPKVGTQFLFPFDLDTST